ncbi:MAG: class I SAM-dependent methyltransferase [Saprospiraceae bacterium]|nr:MAG: class I SAM-dependent methyltransferase [Saprospiraceae bacterium]
MKCRWKIAQFFEALWWWFYLSGKSEDEYLDWKKSYWQAFLEKYGIAVIDGDRIIEIGSGPAGIFMMFPGHDVTAIEPLLSKYKKLMPHFGDGSFRNVNFVEAPFEQYLPGSTFDKVFCLNVINHVSDLPVCIRKLYELAEAGSQLFISVDAHRCSFLKNIFRRIPWDILHPHQHALTDYQCMLTHQGFTIERVELLRSAWIFNYYLIIAKK